MQGTFLMQMPGQPPAERQRGRQRSSLVGGNAGFWDIQKDTSRHRPVGKGCRPNSRGTSFPEHTHEMFHAARTDCEPLGLTSMCPSIEYSAVFLIPIRREYSIPSVWLRTVLNGLHAFLNRKLRRNNGHQVTTGIKSHSELQKWHAICLEYNSFVITYHVNIFPSDWTQCIPKVHGISEPHSEIALTFTMQEKGNSQRM